MNFVTLARIVGLPMIIGKVGPPPPLTMVDTTVTCRYDFNQKKVADLTDRPRIDRNCNEGRI
jgi:hypothetical protein